MTSRWRRRAAPAPWDRPRPSGGDPLARAAAVRPRREALRARRVARAVEGGLCGKRSACLRRRGALPRQRRPGGRAAERGMGGRRGRPCADGAGLTVLARPQVLDEEDLIQECKALNGRLVAFLKQPAVLGALLGYLVDAPPPGALRWAGTPRDSQAPYLALTAARQPAAQAPGTRSRDGTGLPRARWHRVGKPCAGPRRRRRGQGRAAAPVRRVRGGIG